MRLFYFFSILLLLGFATFVTGTYWDNNFTKTISCLGVFSFFVLAYWCLFVFLPYVNWACNQKERSYWDGFFDPPSSFHQIKCVKRFLFSDKLGSWIIMFLGAVGFIGSLLVACYEQNSFEPLITVLIGLSCILLVLFVVCFILYHIRQIRSKICHGILQIVDFILSFKAKMASVKAKMVLLAVLAYLLMCALCVANCDYEFRSVRDVLAALEVTILFGWAFWEVFLLTKTPNRKELSRRKKLYSVIAFLAVPATAFCLIVFCEAYEDDEFLNTCLLVFAPAAFFATKICYRLHEAVNKYLEDSGNGTA